MESTKKIKNNNVDLISNNDPLNKNRALIEDMWESVLREECPKDQADRLIQLKELSYSNQVDVDSSKTFKNQIVHIVNSMDLAESISAARAFSLYFLSIEPNRPAVSSIEKFLSPDEGNFDFCLATSSVKF